MFTFVEKNKYFYKAFLNIPYATFAEYNTKTEVLKNIENKSNLKTTNNIGLYYRASFFGAGIKEMCRLWLERDCIETPQEMAKLLKEEYLNRNY